MFTRVIYQIFLVMVWLPVFSYSAEIQNITFGACYEKYDTDSFWNRNGKRIKSFNDFDQWSLKGFVGFRVTCCDTMVVRSRYSRIEEEANGCTQGFDDMRVSWMRQWGQIKGHRITSRALVVVPVGGRKFNLRYGEWGGEADLFLGKCCCYAGRAVWYELGGGYRVYAGDPSDQVRGYWQLGCQVWKCFSVVTDGKIEWGVFNGKTSTVPNLFAYNNNYRLVKGRLYGVVDLWGYGSLYAGGFKHITGRNVGYGGGYFLGGDVRF